MEGKGKFNNSLLILSLINLLRKKISISSYHIQVSRIFREDLMLALLTSIVH